MASSEGAPGQGAPGDVVAIQAAAEPDERCPLAPENKEQPIKFKFSKLSFKEKFIFVRTNMTVEPVLAIYIISCVFGSLAVQNLNLEKACRVNLRFGDEVCDALSERNTANYTFQEEEVQLVVARISGWRSFIQSLLSATFVLFAGSWSDRHGRRKPFILLTQVGDFLTTAGFIVCHFFRELPAESILVAETFCALFGGWATMFMAVNSYISDVTSEETRTLRIGILNVFYSAGIPLGMALSGVAYKQIGFYGVFYISGLMFVLNFWYGYKCIKEEPKDVQKSEGLVGNVKDFFHVKCLSETFQICFKKGENNRRTGIVLLLMVMIMVVGPMSGDYVVMYLFARLRFNWDEVSYSMFLTYFTIINMIGTSISVGLFSYVLKVDDAVIGMMACVSRILAGFMFAFATTSWMMYLAPLIDMMNGTSLIAMRSIVSKTVPNDELGKVNSVFGAVEGLMPFLFGPLYSVVYQATLHTFPGAFFLVGGAITVPAGVIFAYMYKLSLRDREVKRIKAEDSANCRKMHALSNSKKRADMLS